ncbi:PH-domain-containing protein [Cristinia sonorae]|uniref:PH-domain-containing protein n=1 Tax=Cristinia sonorae TaxID=1940300 RepID=A0A8K0UQG7_9AGAR|nr:PH-domain-containing protein [Cristinia sonorae]
MSQSVPPPSHQEIARKLSIHSAAKPPKKPSIQTAPVSGTESDSDSVFSPDLGSPSPISSASLGAAMIAASSSHPPLSSIAERGTGSGGEESEEDDQGDDDGWHVETEASQRDALHDTVLKTGYLWKKGERRKTWKKRWFVLRPAHLAYYKTSAEYKLLRLLDLADVHSCTPVTLKNHANTFGMVSPTRTFYLQAANPHDVQEWVNAITAAKQSFLATSTQNSATAVPTATSPTTAPIPIPASSPGRRGSVQAMPISASPSQSHSPHGHHFTSSESEDASPSGPRSYPAGDVSGSRQAGAVIDASKVILSGYLMKCGSRRHIWHNRWFVLSGEKLIYCRSHMDSTKPHRQIALAQILDALEYDLPAHRNTPGVNASPVPPHAPSGAADVPDGQLRTHTFKIVTTKRPLLLCAPSEEEEIKWLSAVRALIARRSGAGVVPGDSATYGPPSKTTAAASAGTSVGPPGNAESLATGVSGTNGASGASSGGRRRDSFARRLSLSGGGGGVVAVAHPQEVGGI